MAGMLLSAAGAAIGGSIGGGILGISSVVIGQAIGAAVGSRIDSWLFAPNLQESIEGSRLSDSRITSSTEGATLLRGYGRYLAAGNMIWSARLEENIVVTKDRQSGGKGGSTTTTTTAYQYLGNFAISLGEGPIQGIHRVWVDGKLADLSDVTHRVYLGNETQTPDSLITTKEGAGNVPAYRGVAYVVFEDMLLERYGNRIPQFQFEVTRPLHRTDNNAIGDLVKGVDMIPGTTEFGYDPEVVEQVIFGGDSGTDIIERRRENNHGGSVDDVSDWENALDQLQVSLPNCGVITLVVTWFGDDLRIGNCTLKPKVENSTKETEPHTWRVSSLTRSTATVVSHHDGKVAFGGTPNDASVIRAIQDLKSRGFEVMLYPFIIMDVVEGNTLPNPYSDNAATLGQSQYPWRGRITVSPAAGYVGTNDKTATAATQVASFLGNAAAGDFTASGTQVDYSGPSEWSFRRMILHFAHLCDLAGGVDQFCIGTEMVGSTLIRDNLNAFPFVNGLITLASDVSGIMGGGTEVGYAADWSEYHSYRPSDGTGDVYFNMDDLWSDANIDFIGIDNYLPMSDWRDGTDHLDYQAGYQSIYDVDYLKDNILAGEGYDWYYASTADRVSQTRSDITDGAYSKPWVFRQKDIKGWWENLHYNRPLGVEAGANTSWAAEGKKIYFTEFGAPAVDKGTNQPNVFIDPKSSESFSPYFSSGSRDDEIQRQYIRAMYEFWGLVANNPVSSVYAAPMIDTSKMIYWSYDARPWPTFPGDGSTWADQSNWQFGHWISGRIETVYIPDLLTELAEDFNVTADYDFSRAYGSCDGFTIQSISSFRQVVDPLASLYMFDIIESGATLKAVSQREVQPMATLTLDNIADLGRDDEPIMRTRRQESELPRATGMRFVDLYKTYEPSSVMAQREVTQAESAPVIDTPIVIDFQRAQQLVDRLLYSAWARMEGTDLGVLPELIALEAGDVVTLNASGFTDDIRIRGIADGASRQLTAESFDLGIFDGPTIGARTQVSLGDTVSTAPYLQFLDLPLLNELDIPWRPYVAGYVSPWVGINLYRSVTNSNFSLDTSLLGPATIGETTTTFNPGPTDLWDFANTLGVVLYSHQLQSLDEPSVLGGGNAMAIQNSGGEWEIFQYVNASLTGDRAYTLSKLLRGQLGTEDNMESAIPIGSKVIVLNLALSQIALTLEDVGREYFYKYGPSDRDIGDNTYLSTQKTFTGRGLKPYSPVHIKGVDSSGDIILSWIRRTRIQGDSWDYVGDVPLNETNEEYEIDILNGGGTVVRTLSVTDATTITYTAAQQTTDGISTPFDVIAYQISESVDRGIGRRATING